MTAKKQPSDYRILAIDDNPMNLLLACLVLERAGYTIRSACPDCAIGRREHRIHLIAR